MRARQRRPHVARGLAMAVVLALARAMPAAGDERWVRLGHATAWAVPCRVGSETRYAASCGESMGTPPTDRRVSLPPRPDQARLELAAGLPSAADGTADASPVHLTARLESVGRRRHVTLWERTLDPRRDADRGWQTTVVDVPAGTHGDDTLVLVAEADGGPPAPVAWARPILRRPATTPAPLRGIVVVSLDGLRADRVNATGDRSSTPVMDRIARGGFTFTRAWATAPTARTSHRTMVSGRRPCALAAGGREEEDTAVSRLAAAGWATALIGDDPAATRARGFDRRWRLPPTAFARALETMDTWLTDAANVPFLLAVQTRQLARLDVPPTARPEVDARASPAQRRRARYDAAVTWIDRQLGGLLGTLRRRALLGRVALIVTSAYGTALGEHGDWGRATSVHAEALHVPLLIHHPARGGGRRIPFPVELRDLARTLLDLAGEPIESAIPGKSLLPLLGGGTPTARYVFADHRGRPRASALRTARFSWILRGDRLALYDLANDPTEQTNVAEERPSLAADGLARLRDHRARCPGAGAVSPRPGPVLPERDG